MNKHWINAFMTFMVFGLLCACHSYKKQAEFTGEVKFERAVERRLLFRDSMIESLRLALDSPEIVVFTPRDSTTVTVRARKATVTRNKQKKSIAVEQHADTVSIHDKEYKKELSKRAESSFDWLMSVIVILLVINLLKRK